MAEPFDVAVIGAGPGGYIAAIRAAQLGFKTACIDDWKTNDGKPAPGGTCTNVGCIPSKALLQSSENYEHAGHAFAEHGIEVNGLTVNIAQMLARKDKVVRQNNEGILYLFKKNKVTFFHGMGGFAGGGPEGWQVKVAGAKDEFAVEDHLRPTPLPGFEYDTKAARESCIGVWTSAKGKKLLAQYDGASQLTVDFVQLRIGPEKFKTQGKRVSGCVDLASAPVESIESRLNRVP